MGKKYKFECKTWTYTMLNKHPDKVIYITADNESEAFEKLKMIVVNPNLWCCIGYAENWFE